MQKKIESKEVLIFFATVLGFAFMGAVNGISGALSFAGLGLLIWVVWRGRKL